MLGHASQMEPESLTAHHFCGWEQMNNVYMHLYGYGDNHMPLLTDELHISSQRWDTGMF